MAGASDELPFVLPFIRWANVAPLVPGQVMPPRRIYDHELVYVLSGEGRVMVDNIVHEVVPDTLLMILPRVWHSFPADATTHLTVIGVHFDWAPQHDTLLFPIFQAAHEPVDEARFRTVRQVPGWDLQATPMLSLKSRPRVRRLLEDVVAEFNRHDAGARPAAEALLAAALIEISREATALQQLARATPFRPDAARRVDKARRLLEEPRRTPLSIEEAAATVGWSADHLRRMFRGVLHTSPAKVQTAARIQHARQLLGHENLSVREVAFACGFDDASHFTRVFKKESGLSPRQFLALAKRR